MACQVIVNSVEFKDYPTLYLIPSKSFVYKEDIDHSASADDVMTESGLGMADPSASSSASGGTGYSSEDIRTIPKKYLDTPIEQESGPTGANGLSGSDKNRIDFKKDVMPIEYGPSNTPSGPESGGTDTLPTDENRIDFKKYDTPYEDGDPGMPSGPESGGTGTFKFITDEDMPTKRQMEQL